jgi:hypothetical protein
MQVNSSTVLEVLKMLPALINPRKIDFQKAQMVQDMLFKAGYNIPDLMLQVSFLASDFLHWHYIPQNGSHNWGNSGELISVNN